MYTGGYFFSWTQCIPYIHIKTCQVLDRQGQRQGLDLQGEGQELKFGP